jgi:hypothetical protein
MGDAVAISAADGSGEVLQMNNAARDEENDPDARDPDLNSSLDTSMETQGEGDQGDTSGRKYCPKWLDNKKEKLQKTIDGIVEAETTIETLKAVTENEFAPKKDRENAAKTMTKLRKTIGKLTNEKLGLEVRIAELESAKQKHEAAESKKKLVAKAPELTESEVTTLMTLYYVDFKDDFNGVTSSNVAVWQSLTARFNSWCSTQGTWAEWSPDQLQRKHSVELAHFRDLERKMAGESGDENDTQKEQYAIHHWRPSFNIMKEHETKRAFTVPPLLLSGGVKVMANQAFTQPKPLRLGGRAGEMKWRGVERAASDNRRALEAKANEVTPEERQRVRATKRTLISQQAVADNKAADERLEKSQKFMEERTKSLFAAECAMKEKMHAELMSTLTTLGPSPDDIVAAKLRTLSEMSTALGALGHNNAARPLYERQIEKLMTEIGQLQGE